MAHETYKDEAGIREVVRKFEGCEYALADFTHVRHVTVACWYLCTSGTGSMAEAVGRSDQALERMRSGLQRFLAHHGKQGYHETITRFWIELLGSFLGKFGDGTATTLKVNRALECYGSKDILFSYYTRERVMSDTARREWVEPDLRAIGEARAESAAKEEFGRIIETFINT